MKRRLSGTKSSSPTRTPDNLFSTDIVEVILGISEGPILGLEDGPKDFYIGDTALQAQSGTDNFDSFELIVREGSLIGEDIVSRLGGFASSTSVNTELATGVPVVRSGLHTDIDYIDVRLLVSRLVKENEEGSFEHSGTIKIEYKKTDEATWRPVKTNTSNPLEAFFSGTSWKAWYGISPRDFIKLSPGDRPTYWQDDAPTEPGVRAIWFDKNDDHHPRYKNLADTWIDFANQETSTDGAFTVWEWHELSSWGMDKRTKAFAGPAPAPTQRETGDYWLNTDDDTVLFFNGNTWIAAGSSATPGGIYPSVSNGQIRIRGKATSPFVKELRFPVDRGPGTYDIRVTKITGANTTELFFDVSWESFQEVSAEPMNFPGLATAQLTARASDQFSSIPEFSGVYCGRIVRVPSNYNEVDRTYPGIWDGTWKLRYTNNPAFIAYDLVENDQYGMNAYYPVVLNKWDVYEAGQWCDVRTADGRPRFTFNGVIAEPRPGREAIDFICGIFAGRFFDDGNGSAVIRIDKDGDATNVFTPENVEEGLFTYSFTEISTRHNDLTVTFINPDLNWQEDRRRVPDQNHIDKYGRIPHNFVAVGCTDAKEAITRARYKLITALTETMVVNFKTNRQGLYMSPYDIILVGDDEMGAGLHGRVLEVTADDAFSLRDPIYLEPGFDYRVSFLVVNAAGDGYETVKFALAEGLSGTVMDIVVDGILPELPEHANFTIETMDGTAAPRAFRVMSIAEVDGNLDLVEITAVGVNRLKWDFIDGAVPDIEYSHTQANTNIKPEPVAAARVTGSTGFAGSRPINIITLDWDLSPTPLVAKYKIFMSRNGSPLSLLGETVNLEFEWIDVPPGEYIFHITASLINGKDSDPAIIEHRLIGDYRDPKKVQNLRLLDEPYETIYESRSPRFGWDPVNYPEHQDYLIRIVDGSNIVLYETYTTELFFVYEQTLNATLNDGFPERSFSFRVASRDQYGALSDLTILAVTNAAPLSPNGLSVTLSYDQAIIQFDQPDIRDFSGVVIHRSLEFNFVPDETTAVFRGTNTNISIPCERGFTYYFRVAVYDFFGETELNFSAQYFLTVPTELQEISQTVISMLDQLAGNVSDIFNYIDQVAGNASIHNAASEIIRQDLAQNVSNAFARIAEESEVRANAIQAVANDVTALQAGIVDLADETEAQAGAISALQTQVTAKPEVFYQAVEPATTGPEGSIWIDSDDNNKIFVLQSAEWIDASVAGMTVFYQDSPPTTSVLGALWFDTNDENKLHRWNGTEWQDVSDSRVTAMASALTAVEAAVNEVSASGLFKMEVQAGVGSVLARQIMYVKAELGDDWEEAGMVIEVYTEESEVKSRIVLNADQLVVTDGSTTSSPLVFEDGELKLQVARIGSAIIEQFSTPSGKLTINGSGTNSDISIRT